MNRRSLYLIAIGLISVIVVSSVIAYELGFIRSSEPSPSVPSGTFPSILWQRPIENFATALAVDDGKVFTLDKTAGVVNCYDSQSGKSIWNSSFPDGGFYVAGLVVSGGKVYAGASDNHVVCLDEATGQFQWSFQGIWITYSRGPPTNIIVKDNRVFSITDAVSVHDATTGAFLWQAGSGNMDLSTPSYAFGIITDLKTWNVAGYPLRGDPFDGNYVYATGGDYASMDFFKLNTDNGAVIWRSNVTWDDTIRLFGVDYAPEVLANSQGQVIIYNIINGKQSINQLFSLNTTSGEELWSIDSGATIYNPIVYNDLLLFGASDGNFYALNLADGIIAWKTKVDTQNLFSSYVNSTNPAQTSPMQINIQNKQVFWSFRVELGWGSSNYTGELCSLDLATGNLKWIKQIDVNETLGTIGFFSSDSIFLTQNNALYIFNESTSNLVQSQQFDHYVLPPIILGNVTFVAADLWLFAYA
jgi:outer membrane protein assembly factor BamB